MRASAHCEQLGRRLGARLVGAQQPLGDHVVLADAQRAERDVALDDFAGARIGDRRAVAPAARRAVHPVDDVVADVERAGILRQQLDLERVAITRGLERLVPPARALEQRRADRLRRAGIEVIDDRLHRIADRRGRILLLQPMPLREAQGLRLARAAPRSSRTTCRRTPSADRSRAAHSRGPAARRSSGARACSPLRRSRRHCRRPRRTVRRRRRRGRPAAPAPRTKVSSASISVFFGKPARPGT